MIPVVDAPAALGFDAVLVREGLLEAELTGFPRAARFLRRVERSLALAIVSASVAPVKPRRTAAADRAVATWASQAFIAA